MDASTSTFGSKWIGPLQSGWSMVPARSIFAERKEKSSPDDIHLTPSQKYAVLPQAEYMKITGGRVVLNLIGSDNMKHVEKGDFVVHLRSFQGGIEYSKYTGKVSNAYTVLVPKGNVVDNFYRYVLKSHGFISELSKTTDQLRDGQSIKYSQLALLKYPLSNKIIQQKIADFLDVETAKIDNLIAKQEHLLELLEEKRRATITNAVTRGLDPNVELKETNIPWLGKISNDYEVLPLKSIASYQEGPGIMAVDFHESGIPLIRISGLTEGGVLCNGKNFLSPKKVEKAWSHFRLKPHDLLISASASTGVISEVLPNSEAVGAVAYTGIIRLQVVDSTRLSRNYLKYFVQSQPYLEQIKLSITGTAMQHYGPSHLGRFKITLPKLEKQQKIIVYLDNELKRVEQIKEKIQTQISLLRERRTSLISHAVTGKIKV